MKVIDVPLNEIEVGDRRRTDLGDIASLARGIERVGLLEPIIVDRDGQRHRLIAGERRYRAAVLLRWKTIPANLRENLTEEQLRDIELEENENRKSLTERERTRTLTSSKRLVENAKKAAEVLARSGPKPKNGTKGGRPVTPDSTRAVAEALGTSRQNVERAQQHVDTVERFPWMKGAEWKQSDVLRIGEKLEKVPEHEQQKIAEVLGCARVMDPKLAVQLVERIAEKPRKEREEIYALSESQDPRDRSLALTKANNNPPMPDPRIHNIQTALDALRRATTPYPKDAITSRLNSIIQDLRTIQGSLKNKPAAEATGRVQ